VDTSIDVVRSFWDARPCNLRHSPSPVGTRQYFDEVEARKYFVEPHIPAFADFPAWRNRRVLEIGCGLGTDGVNFARQGAHYTALELSGESLRLAQQRFELYGLKGEFYQGNAEDLTAIVPVQPFDLVYSFGVIHHTPHPEKIVASVQQYLGPQSEFRLMLYAKHSWKAYLIEAGLEQPEAQSGCPIALTYAPADIRALLQDYEILEMRQAHIFPYVIDKYVRYEYEIQPWFRAMPKALFDTLESRLGWHTLIRCRLKSSVDG
jgi:SAM-dependent methyltransferase